MLNKEIQTNQHDTSETSQLFFPYNKFSFLWCSLSLVKVPYRLTLLICRVRTHRIFMPVNVQHKIFLRITNLHCAKSLRFTKKIMETCAKNIVSRRTIYASFCDGLIRHFFFYFISFCLTPLPYAWWYKGYRDYH